MALDPNLEARKVLNKVWKNRGFPVDPVTICQLMGVQVLDTELPDTVSGALIKEAGKDPVIALHRYDHSNRKRFSCSHELGHYISRIESSDDSPEYEVCGSSRTFRFKWNRFRRNICKSICGKPADAS